MLNSSSVFQFKQGDHICVFYRDSSTLLETIAPYLVDGLRNGERCFCAQKAAMVPRLRLALETLGVDTHQEIKRGSLEIHTEEEVYFVNGKFQPEAIMETLERSIDESLRQGYAGFRTAGEMSWAVCGSSSCDQLLEYERMVDNAYPDRAAIGICQYPVQDFSREVLEEVIAAHRLALEETMVSRNHSALSLRYGDYVADIVADRFDPATAFHYVVQRHRSTEVLGWGIESDMDQAMQASQSIITDLSRPAKTDLSRSSKRRMSMA